MSFRYFMIGLDQFVNTIFGGYPDETISARAYRNSIMGSTFWKVVETVINVLFFWNHNPGLTHCETAHLDEMQRLQSPVSYRVSKQETARTHT